MGNDFLSKLIDLFYNKTKLSVLLFFVLGFTLRIIAARNLGVSADDANHAIRPIGIFNSDKLAFFDQSTSLWYYIQGVFYNLFGSTTLASRFASVLFGSLLIILMFLFVKRVFKSEKAALISSFLVAISPMLIKITLPEMDMAAAFFLILGAYFLFGYLESNSRKELMLSALAMGIGIMIKLYILFFAFSFILFLILKKYCSEKDIKKAIKPVLLFGIIISILVIPTLAHNYLLYKDKGFMDLIFTNTLKLGVEKAKEFYSWGAGWMPYTDYKGFFFGNQRNFDPTAIPGFLIVLGFFLKADPILFILGILGLIFMFKKNRDYFWFFLIVFLPAFVYLGAQIPMSKHFVWGLALFAPMAGVFGEALTSKLGKIRLRYILLVFLIFNLFYLGMPRGVQNAHFYGESSFNQMVDFKQTIPDSALVVADSRIYRGNIHWGLAGTNFIEAAQFFQAAQELNKQGNLKDIDVYYFECVIDDCGWGTVEGQPEFNSSMEQVTAFFENNSFHQEDFEAPNPYDYYLPYFGEKRTDYRVYKTTLALNPAILKVAKSTHSWFMYPENYDRSISPIFDDYDASGINSLIEKLAWFIFYLELVFSFIAMIYIFYIFIKE